MRILAALTLLISALLSPLSTAAPLVGCGTTSWVSDPSDPNNGKIEAAIRKVAEKPSGELTKADLEKVTRLHLWNAKLTDVKGLEKLTRLEVLSLNDNPALIKAQIAELKKALRKCDIRHNATNRAAESVEDRAARFAAMTPEEAGAFEDDIKQKLKGLGGNEAKRLIVDLALIPPKMNTSPLPEYGYDRLDYGMTIGIERTPGGRLWACWVAGGDSAEAFFVLATSDDDGETWSKPRLVIDPHKKNLPQKRRVLVGNLWTDPTGKLWLFFDQSMEMFDGRAGVWASQCKNPDAKNPLWSRARRIWHGSTLNKPTVLSTGEWMLPISLLEHGAPHYKGGGFQELYPLRGANVFVSEDKGASWQRRGAVRFPHPNWHEHMIVERRDGSLWMLARTGNGIMESTSTDGGKNWSKPTASKINHPVARFHIRRLASGRLLLIKHGDTIDSHQHRSKLTAWLSENDGESWSGGLMLDKRNGISYPDGFQAPDGTIYISYDRNRATDGEILLARFTEEDIVARMLVGKKSKLQIQISRARAGD